MTIQNAPSHPQTHSISPHTLVSPSPSPFPPLSSQHSIITALLSKNPLERQNGAEIPQTPHSGGDVDMDIIMQDLVVKTPPTPQVALIDAKWWNRYMELLEEQSRHDFESNTDDSMRDVDDAVGEDASHLSMQPKVSDPDMVMLPPVDNSELLENLAEWREKQDTAPILSQNKVEKTHFEYVSVEAFEQLLAWYGGGPRIYRNVVSQSTSALGDEDWIVDLYPMRIAVALHIENEPTHTFQEMEVFKGTTVKQLRGLIQQRFDTHYDESRLWESYCSSPYKPLDDELTLAEIDAQRDRSDVGKKQQFLLEGKKAHQRYSLNDAASVSTPMLTGPTYRSSSSRFSSSSSSYSTYSSSASRWSITAKEDTGDGRRSTPGVCGLSNLGNTCFMNSAIQCLSKTPQIRDYFVQGLYEQEINKDNPLGMNGEIAQAFGSIMKLMWSGENSSISPRGFKHVIGKFAPQFVGYQQHDSSELVQYLLDGLHEDLNRIKNKPYTQIVEGKNLKASQAAERAWKVHLLRNDSIIVDKFKGQLKSTLVCPQCKNVSITFDPFIHLPLPLPDSVKILRITVVYHAGRQRTTKFALEVKKSENIASVRNKLAALAGVQDPQSLVVVEIFQNKVHKYFEDKEKAANISPADHIWAFEMPLREVPAPNGANAEGSEENHAAISPSPSKALDSRQKVITVRIQSNTTRTSYTHGSVSSTLDLFDAPLVIPYQSDVTTNKDIYDVVLAHCLAHLPEEAKQSLNLDLSHPESFLPTAESTTTSDDNQYLLKLISNESYTKTTLPYTPELAQFKKSGYYYSREVASLTCSLNGEAARIGDKTLNEFLKESASTLSIDEHESAKKAHKKEGATLNMCLDLFQSTEQLGETDMWRCPVCKEPVQAEKTIELWKLPEVLVIQLKRFQYHDSYGGKIDTFVEYPIRDLDLSAYVPELAQHKHYDLFGVSNHFGGLGGGHYIAHAKVGDEWYRFDDSMATPVRESAACSSDAYVLFYVSKQTSPVEVGEFKDGKELVKQWGLEEHAQG